MNRLKFPTRAGSNNARIDLCTCVCVCVCTCTCVRVYVCIRIVYPRHTHTYTHAYIKTKHISLSKQTYNLSKVLYDKFYYACVLLCVSPCTTVRGAVYK